MILVNYGPVSPDGLTAFNVFIQQLKKRQVLLYFLVRLTPVPGMHHETHKEDDSHVNWISLKTVKLRRKSEYPEKSVNREKQGII